MMTREQANNLKIGTRVRIKGFYGPTEAGDVNGEITYGEWAQSMGVVIDGYDYPFQGDLHGFNGWTDEMISRIEVIEK